MREYYHWKFPAMSDDSTRGGHADGVAYEDDDDEAHDDIDDDDAEYDDDDVAAEKGAVEVSAPRVVDESAPERAAFHRRLHEAAARADTVTCEDILEVPSLQTPPSRAAPIIPAVVAASTWLQLMLACACSLTDLVAVLLCRRTHLGLYRRLANHSSPPHSPPRMQDMESEGLPPGASAFHTLAFAYVKAGDVDTALAIVKQEWQLGIQPLEKTYVLLVYGFVEAGDLERAMAVMQSMTRAGQNAELGALSLSHPGARRARARLHALGRVQALARADVQR